MPEFLLIDTEFLTDSRIREVLLEATDVKLGLGKELKFGYFKGPVQNQIDPLGIT